DAVDREDVVRHDHVRREDRDDALHLVAVALRPQRPDRPVDHARRQDRLLTLAPLALEETAWDLPGRVHPLLDVDREREEVRPLASLGAALCGRKDQRVAGPHDDRTVRLLRQLACLERDLTAADGHADRNRRLLLLGLDNAHLSSSTLLSGGRRFESARTCRCGGLPHTSTPRGLTELPPEAQLLDEGAVPLEILLLQVVQEPAPPADELQQPAPRVVILRVRPQMFGEAVDALGQHRDLDFRGAGVRLVLAERLGCLLLRFLGEGHVPPWFVSPSSQQTPRKEDAHGRGGVADRVATPSSGGFRPSGPPRSARRLHVAPDLLDELGLACEGPLLPEPVPELDGQALPVEVALEVEQEGLDPALGAAVVRVDAD